MKLSRKFKLSSNQKLIIIPALILLFSVIIFAAVPNNGHSASTVCIKIDGTERTLQYAIQNNLIGGTHTYAACASAPIGGHNIDKIWISVNGVEMNLQEAIATNNLDGTSAPSSSYSQTLNPGHLATEIVVTVNGQETTLQQAVNTGELACTDTCSSLGYTCGTYTICGVSTNCGTCCTDTCSSLGYTCGTYTICGVSTNCGTCPTYTFSNLHVTGITTENLGNTCWTVYGFNTNYYVTWPCSTPGATCTAQYNAIPQWAIWTCGNW